MQYMPSLVFQAVCFLYSAGLGFTLGIIYDLFRMLFYLLTGSDKKFLVFRDIIFLSVCLAATFIFLLVMCDGQLLTYVFLGEVLGLWVYFYSLSSFLFLPVKRLIKHIRRQFTKIKTLFIKIKTRFAVIREKIYKNLYNCGNFLRKHLHIRHNIVYNLCVKLYPSIIFKNRGDGSGKSEEK